MLPTSPTNPTRSPLARLLVLPENRFALAALQDILAALAESRGNRLPNPLYLHGLASTGKTHLIQALAAELNGLDIDVCMWTANDFAEKTDFTDARDADLWVVEDLQHLPARFVATMIQLLDERCRQGAPTIVTAAQGPSGLRPRGAVLPHRLTSRLAGGLVVGLAPLQTPSRRRLLDILSEEAKLQLTPEALAWLAKHLIGGARQMAGAVRQLKTLQALQEKPLALADICAHFRGQVEATASTVQHIAERVSGYFRVKPKLVISASRSRKILLPRQVSMFLARQLTGLSLEKIGSYFGGRDHKTVQHACKKVEQALRSDACLSGIVHQLRAELT